MPKLETALCVHVEFDNHFAHIKGYVCKPVLNAHGFPVPVDRYDHQLHNIRLHSQAHNKYEWTGMYGMEVAYDCFDRINFRDAQKAVKTLAPIERKMQKIQDLEGQPKSYGQWLNGVARAIGAKTVLFRRIKPSAGASQYLGVSGGDIVWQGDALEKHVAEWAHPELKVAA